MTWTDTTPGPQQRADDEYVRRALESLSHSASIIHVRADAPVQGGANVVQNSGVAPWTRWFDTTNKLDKIWSPTHNLWVCLTPQSALVNTDQGTASATYADLATVGPAVTLDTGTSVIINLSAASYISAANARYMGCAVTGASSIAAADANAAQGRTSVTTDILPFSITYLLTGLTAGSNTFTAKYRRDTAGTANFYNRKLTVWALPT